jgi:hypothetical protein
VRNGLISGLTGGLISEMGMFLAFDVIVATVLGLSFGLISGLLNGGHMGIQHAVLRIVLWRNHLAPL